MVLCAAAVFIYRRKRRNPNQAVSKKPRSPGRSGSPGGRNVSFAVPGTKRQSSYKNLGGEVNLGVLSGGAGGGAKASGLPFGWGEAVDDQGVPYYYSTTTGESTYERPSPPAATAQSPPPALPKKKPAVAAAPLPAAPQSAKWGTYNAQPSSGSSPRPPSCRSDPNPNPYPCPNPNPNPDPNPDPNPNQVHRCRVGGRSTRPRMARPTTTTLRAARPRGSGRPTATATTTTHRPSQQRPSPALPPQQQGRRRMRYRGTRLEDHHRCRGAWVVGRRHFRGAWVDLHRSLAAQLPWASAGCWRAGFEGTIGRGTTERGCDL